MEIPECSTLANPSTTLDAQSTAVRTSQCWPSLISTEHHGHSVNVLNSLAVNLSTWYTRLSDTSIAAPDEGGVWSHDGTCQPESLSHRICMTSVVSVNTLS